MPKETIRILSDDDPNIFDIKVGWTKDKHMQIGLESFDQTSLVWTIYENKVEQIGEEVYKAITEVPRSLTNVNEELGKAVLNVLDIVTHGPVEGIWTTPSRNEVNDLIRLLRRARDAAFGKDE